MSGKQTYKKQRLAVLAEWEELQMLTQKRRIKRFRRAVLELQQKGRGAIVCSAELSNHHVEGQWFIVDIESWKRAPWFSLWNPNLELDANEHKYVYIKINESYTGKYSLGHLQINKPGLDIYGLWYLTPDEFQILAPLLFYQEHNYSWLQEQVSLDADGNPHGHHYQCHSYGPRTLAELARRVATYRHGQITWGDSKCINAYFGKLMFLTMEQSRAYYAYHKKTYGNEPEKQYAFDEEGIPRPRYYSGLFDSDVKHDKLYLKLTGCSMESVRNRSLLLQMRYSNFIHKRNPKIELPPDP
jgi:hypothetical protein